MPVQRCRACGHSYGADEHACPACGALSPASHAAPTTDGTHAALRIGVAVMVGLIGVALIGLCVRPA